MCRIRGETEYKVVLERLTDWSANSLPFARVSGSLNLAGLTDRLVCVVLGISRREIGVE